MNAKKIEGSVALVTGANRGIGRAIVEALLTRGVKKVYATARDTGTLRDLRDPRVVPLRLDVTAPEQIRAISADASDVELLFNNAGVSLIGGIIGAGDLEQARQQMEVNYFGPLQLLQQLSPALARTGGGAVIYVGSLTQATRTLLGAQGTAVHGVYPGPVDTDMTRGIDMPKASPRDVARAIIEGIEAGREDIYPDAYAAEFDKLFGASPKAAERQFAAMAAGSAG
jgi:NAD(P)-dependent dehydrogenase (short-subunit alcohol dehydrogenase family)